MAEPDDADEPKLGAFGPEDDEAARVRGGNRFRRRITEQLGGLLDPEGAFRRGQDLVTGVTQATKEEVMRIVSAEMRTFLEKIDAVDLLQRVIAGLSVDVHMQVRFSRTEEDSLEPDIKTKTELRSRVEEEAEVPAESQKFTRPPVRPSEPAGPGAKTVRPGQVDPAPVDGEEDESSEDDWLG